jgi:predicted nuclease with TOPRIM domain
MQAFELPAILAEIEADLTYCAEHSLDPSEALNLKIRSFMEEGPESLDRWQDTIDELESGIEAINKRMKELQTRRWKLTEARKKKRDILYHSVTQLAAALNMEYIKTPERTYFIRERNGSHEVVVK